MPKSKHVINLIEQNEHIIIVCGRY